jgi:hypothetical protein
METETLIIWICGYIAFCGLMVAPLWVVSRRAGFAPGLSLLFLLPAAGPLLLLYILAFRPWTTPQGTSEQDG